MAFNLLSAPSYSNANTLPEHNHHALESISDKVLIIKIKLKYTLTSSHQELSPFRIPVQSKYPETPHRVASSEELINTN